MSNAIDQTLSRIYYDPKHPSSFSSIDSLWRACKGSLSKKEVEEWLEAQETYTLHRPVRKRFPRNRYYVDNIDDLWQADLNTMISLKNSNQGFCHLLSVIDVFSKYAWCVPLMSKKGHDVSNAFKAIFKQDGRVPLKLQTDKGTEFLNKTFQDCLKKHNIIYYSTKTPDLKASIVERFNRTLKTRMWKYFTHKTTTRYVDVLPELMHAYNHTAHRSIGMAPADVNDSNVLEVWRNLYGKKTSGFKKKKKKFKKGDTVRISKEKMIFEKGHEENWSEEVFKIKTLLHRTPVVYIIEDLQGEEIDGSFYEEELQRVQIHDAMAFKINKVLDSRGKGSKKKLFVSWKGYPSKFNSWIAAAQVESLS